MKKNIFLAIIVALLINACNEDKFLKETPLDFLGGNNAYITEVDFNAAIYELYYQTRYEFYCNGDWSIDYIYGTDLVQNQSSGQEKSNLSANYHPTAGTPSQHWNRLYILIAQANTVISRIPKSALSVEQQFKFEAKARFFRGLAYRTLVFLYGGVPLQLEEVTAPKTDYTRSSRAETLNQAIADVKFAAENLDDITKVKNGEISSSAAYHLLSELYLASGQNQEAVDAATLVINNPAFGLMKNRFGSRTVQPGDVYWDLFQRNNQNRSAGNTEGIWVIQFEADVNGGGSNTSWAFWTNPGNYILERHCAPQTGLFRFVLSDGTQLVPFSWPTGDYTGGRGIGTAGSTEHFYTEVWTSDFNNDIRNSNYNFVRKFKFNNPTFISQYGATFGDSIDVMNPILPAGVTVIAAYTGPIYNPAALPGRFLMGYQSKCTTPYDHPAGLYQDAATYLLKSTGGGTFTDQYMFRLAETYLLRAEAYLNLGQTGNAALDINEVRGRANASPVDAGNVDLDYILDERMRELGIEEKRRLTLGRLGEDVFYDRVTRFNPYYTDVAVTADGLGFQRKFTLWPIPQSAIEANKDGVLEQNPGY
jgi:hypothetical protein